MDRKEGAAVVDPSWSLQASGGPDAGAASAFIAGFGVVEITFAVVFVFLVAYVTLRKLLSAAGF